MSDNGYKLPAEFYGQQFHNSEHYSDREDEPRKMWWEMPEGEKPQGYASGGSVISQLRKRGKMAEKGKSAEFGSHPAHKIPGIHIVTAETGEPVFTGEK